ncbi:hypothetical protein Bpfe_010449 [Biomphalaria pfeifferi]|uniref:Uncharacterized protein n=1 Tax=Biomphalaria pfeifferi TaxID=112525 RepID=A0AAD8BUE2_BIOPF|nr:hypothetical protein Bpfe_010449 [Biomphalaria pfeifferi]
MHGHARRFHPPFSRHDPMTKVRATGGDVSSSSSGQLLPTLATPGHVLPTSRRVCGHFVVSHPEFTTRKLANRNALKREFGKGLGEGCLGETADTTHRQIKMHALTFAMSQNTGYIPIS